MQLFRDARVGYTIADEKVESFVAAFVETVDDGGHILDEQTGWYPIVGPNSLRRDTPFNGTFSEFLVLVSGYASYEYALEDAITRLEHRLRMEREA